MGFTTCVLLSLLPLLLPLILCLLFPLSFPLPSFRSGTDKSIGVSTLDNTLTDSTISDNDEEELNDSFSRSVSVNNNDNSNNNKNTGNNASNSSYSDSDNCSGSESASDSDSDWDEGEVTVLPELVDVAHRVDKYRFGRAAATNDTETILDGMFLLRLAT